MAKPKRMSGDKNQQENRSDSVKPRTLQASSGMPVLALKSRPYPWACQRHIRLDSGEMTLRSVAFKRLFRLVADANQKGMKAGDAIHTSGVRTNNLHCLYSLAISVIPPVTKVGCFRNPNADMMSPILVGNNVPQSSKGTELATRG